jgi:probable HAF family extracellular repeat protein
VAGKVSWPKRRDKVSFHSLAGGARSSTAVAVSANGSVIVGHAKGGLEVAVKWQAGKMIPLGRLDLPGDDRSYATAVSPDGKIIVGESTATETTSKAVIWRRGKKIEALPSVGKLGSSAAVATSNGGRVVVGNGYVVVDKTITDHVVQWNRRRGKLIKSKSGKKTASRATGASRDGKTIVGEMAGYRPEAFRWKNGKLTALGFLPDIDGSSANAVSPDGKVVVGRSGPNAFRWANGKMTDLGRLQGFDRCAARGVSNRGKRIIGNCTRKSRRSPPRAGDGPPPEPKGPSGDSAAFVWDRKHGMRSINEIVIDARWDISEAFGISADGTTIVGNGWGPNSPHEAWMLVLPKGK